MTCAICLDDATPTNPFVPIEGPNGPDPHIFHETCIKTWATQNPVCPLCRARITHINGVPIVSPIPKDLVGAAESGDPAAVAEIVRRSRVPDETRGRALIFAAAHSHDAIVWTLVGSGPIPILDRFVAAYNAWVNGDQIMTSFLLGLDAQRVIAIGITLAIFICAALLWLIIGDGSL